MLWKSVEPRCVPIFSVFSIASWLWVNACIQNQEAAAVLWGALHLDVWSVYFERFECCSQEPRKESIESGEENEMQSS